MLPSEYSDKYLYTIHELIMSFRTMGRDCPARAFPISACCAMGWRASLVSPVGIAYQGMATITDHEADYLHITLPAHAVKPGDHASYQ
jgi:hypothetical protein